MPMIPTMQLRFVKRRVGRNVVRILQQRFEHDGVLLAEEFWLDVPMALDCEMREAPGATQGTFPPEGH